MDELYSRYETVHANVDFESALAKQTADLRAQLAERDAQLAEVKDVAVSLEEIIGITNDEDFGDLEERLEEAFSREDVMNDANKALARYKMTIKAF